MVGVDIGCGMETVELREHEIDFKKLDAPIRRKIPYGREVQNIHHPLNAAIDLIQVAEYYQNKEGKYSIIVYLTNDCWPSP